jgi:hypothetical protein
LLTGDVFNQAKTFPKATFVFFFGYIGVSHRNRGHYEGGQMSGNGAVGGVKLAV